MDFDGSLSLEGHVQHQSQTRRSVGCLSLCPIVRRQKILELRMHPAEHGRSSRTMGGLGPGLPLLEIERGMTGPRHLLKSKSGQLLFGVEADTFEHQVATLGSTVTTAAMEERPVVQTA